MEVWTEILGEKVAAVHFECDDHRYKAVAVPLEDEVYEYEVRGALDYLEDRAASKRFIRRSRAMREDIKQKERARSRLVEAGYDESEIPL